MGCFWQQGSRGCRLHRRPRRESGGGAMSNKNRKKSRKVSNIILRRQLVYLSQSKCILMWFKFGLHRYTVAGTCGWRIVDSCVMKCMHACMMQRKWNILLRCMIAEMYSSENRKRRNRLENKNRWNSRFFFRDKKRLLRVPTVCKSSEHQCTAFLLLNGVNLALFYIGSSVAEWLACWTHAQKGLGSNRSRDVVG